MEDLDNLEEISIFLQNRDDARISDCLVCLQPFVIQHARSWQNSGMDFAARCREILSEIFLILIEDFRPEKANSSASMKAYISLRLRRLLRPKTSRSIPFGLHSDLPDTGRFSFNALRLDTVENLVRCVREELANTRQEQVKLLEFFFIHIFPDLAKGSRYLANCFTEDEMKRIEADKKRHQSFNRSLRNRFEKLTYCDWKDIGNWTPGERSHLAWRIISFSQFESDNFDKTALNSLENWRDKPESFSLSDISYLEIISHGVKTIERLYQSPVTSCEEEAAPYGVIRGNIAEKAPHPGVMRDHALKSPKGVSTPSADDIDIVAMLVAPFPQEEQYKAKDVEASYGKATQPSEEQKNMVVEVESYQKAADEVEAWICKLLREIKPLDKSIAHRRRIR